MTVLPAHNERVFFLSIPAKNYLNQRKINEKKPRYLIKPQTYYNTTLGVNLV